MRLLKPEKKRQRTTQRLTVSSSQGQRRKTSRKGAKSSAGKLPIFGRLAPLTALFAGRKSTRTSKRRHPKRLVSFANLRRAVAAIAVFGVLGGGLWLWQDGWMARQTAAAERRFRSPAGACRSCVHCHQPGLAVFSRYRLYLLAAEPVRYSVCCSEPLDRADSCPLRQYYCSGNRVSPFANKAVQAHRQ